MNQNSIAPAFPKPFTKDQLRQDILNLYVQALRRTALFADADQVFALSGQVASQQALLWDPEMTPADMELTYAAVTGSAFAKALEQQFEFGFNGVVGVGAEPLEYWTTHTWVAAHLLDLVGSRFEEEWASHGVDCSESVRRCLHTSELANARLVLEGREPFSNYPWARGDGKSDEQSMGDALTVRQMALLAGMEEMSIRTAASRKGANQLRTVKEDNRTLVRPEDAREWLKAKGRYVPISRQWVGGDLNLETTKFSALHELEDALRQRLCHLEVHAEGNNQDLADRLYAAFAGRGHEAAISLTPKAVADTALLADVAELLQLPAELLSLRARQALLTQELAVVGSAIRQQVPASM